MTADRLVAALDGLRPEFVIALDERTGRLYRGALTEGGRREVAERLAPVVEQLTHEAGVLAGAEAATDLRAVVAHNVRRAADLLVDEAARQRITARADAIADGSAPLYGGVL